MYSNFYTTIATVLFFFCMLFQEVTAEQKESGRENKITRPAMHAEMIQALNSQLKLEIESSYLYLGMSTYFAEEGLDGFSHWFMLHSNEEWEHAMKLYKFLLDRGASVDLPTLQAPKTKWASPLAVVEEALLHEITVSQAIKSEYEMAQEFKEYDVGEFLLWYLKEQVEEENLFEQVLNKLYLVQGGHSSALIFLDHEMGKRKP